MRHYTLQRGLLAAAPFLAAALAAGVGAAQESPVGDAGAPDAAEVPASDAGAPVLAPEDSVTATAVVEEAQAQGARFDELAIELEGQPAIGEVRVRLARSAEAYEGLLPVLTPEALERASRSELIERIRMLGSHETELGTDTDVLAERLARLEEIGVELAAAQERWAAVADEMRANVHTPPAALAAATDTKRRADEMVPAAAERTTTVVELQAQLVAHRTQVEESLAGVEEARTQMRAQLFRRVAPPIWESLAPDATGVPALISVDRAWATFYSEYGQKLPIHAGLLVLLFVVVFTLSRWATRLTGPDTASVVILTRPLAAVAIVALVAVRFLYPQAPAAIYHLAAVGALVPLLRLLPLLTERRALDRPIWALMGLFATQELFAFAPAPAFVSRLVAVGISVGLGAIVFWILRRGLAAPDENSTRIERAVPHLLKLVVGLLAISILAEVIGYTNLAALLTPGLLINLYVVLLLVAAVRVLDAIVTASMASRWARISRAVKDHRELIGARIRGGLHFAMIFVWLYGTLMIFDLDAIVVESLVAVLAASLTVGSWELSLGDIVRFGVVIYIAALAARLAVFTLEQEVFRHLELPRGAPSTISRLVRYAIWALGFVVAIGAAGVDTSSLALLVSALSVGIGFGLQTIVNNFVSGLILIFERPIREGDTVELGGMVGQVKAIGLRASIVRTLQGSEVIVPNADLVSSQVINWTLSDQERRVVVSVGVAYGTDPEVVLAMLAEVAASTDEVQEMPAAVPLFRGFGDSSLDFELRFWVNLRHDWPTVASKVTVEINRRLSEMNIEIPFPQRDLNVRSVEPELLKLIEKT